MRRRFRVRQQLGGALAFSAIATFALLGGTARAVSLDTLTITAPASMTVTADQLCPQGDCALVSYTFTVSGGVPR